MGDAIDNIPGVPKCGPKTAAKWLNEYGSLDEVIAHAGEVKGKIGENLRTALPQLPL
jgi:DNA polymerase-1